MSRRHHYNFGRVIRGVAKAARSSARAQARYAKLEMQAAIEQCVQHAHDTNEAIDAAIEELHNVLLVNLRQTFVNPLKVRPEFEEVHQPSQPDRSIVLRVIISSIAVYLLTSVLLSSSQFVSWLSGISSIGVGYLVFRVRMQQVKRNVSIYDKAYAEETARTNQRNQQVQQSFNAFVADYDQRHSPAIEDYFSFCLEHLHLPEGSPENWEIAFNEAEGELLVRFELPHRDVVPTMQSVKFIKTRREYDIKERKSADIGKIYLDLALGLSLSVLNRIFVDDKDRLVKVLTLNAFVETIDLSTGKDIESCLVSVRCTRAKFEQLDLARVDKAVCLRSLGAKFTSSAFDMVTVVPFA